MIKSLGLLFIVCMFVGCAHSVHMVEVSDIDFKGSDQKKEISASAEQFVVMGFVTQTEYVNEATEKLKRQCPDKKISGIQARYSTSLGFFSWTNKLVLQGFCHM